MIKQRIIVTEDDPGLQEIFSIILKKAGYLAEVIGDGHRLLKNEFEPPHLFLLDKQLSGCDGIDICRHLKEQANTAHIPVIMISANPNIGQLSKIAGADAYIEKPFDISHLLSTLEAVLLRVQKPESQQQAV